MEMDVYFRFKLTWLVMAINKTAANVMKKHCRVFLNPTMK